MDGEGSFFRWPPLPLLLPPFVGLELFFRGDAFDGDGESSGSAGSNFFPGEDGSIAGVGDSVGGAVSVGLDGLVVGLLLSFASSEARLGRLPVD